MPSNELPIRYKLTRADLVAYATRGLLRNWVLAGAFGIGFVFVFVNTFNFAKSDHTHQLSTAGCAFVALFSGLTMVGIGVCAGAIAVLLMYYARKRIRSLEERTVTITESGLAVKSASFEGVHKRTGIRRIVSTRRRLLIHWDSTTGLIIPKRCFNSTAEAAEFEKEIRKRWHSALTPTSSAP